jgi:hypothetical protein
LLQSIWVPFLPHPAMGVIKRRKFQLICLPNSTSCCPEPEIILCECACLRVLSSTEI